MTGTDTYSQYQEVINKSLEDEMLKLKIKNEELEKENAELKEEINKIAFARGNLEEENAELKLKLEALEGQTPWKDIKDKSELIKENAELKGLRDVATLIRANNDTVITLVQLNNELVYANQLINKLKKCDNCKENTTMNPYCIDCEHHSKWVLAD